MPSAFTCPHCGHQTNVADQSAGASGPCAQCGQTITMPGAARKATYSVCPPIEIVLVVLLLACVAVVLAMPGLFSVRGTPRPPCVTNLSKIAQAMYQYEQHHRFLPPAFLADKSGKPMHSWRVLILPFLGYDDLYGRYNFSEPWDGPSNRKLVGQMPREYHCPSSKATSRKYRTSYVVVVGKNTVFPGRKAATAMDARDGLRFTLMVVESCDTGINWMEPRDFDFESMSMRINDGDRQSIGSNHFEGAHVLFGSGEVRFLGASLPAATLKSLIDGNDGKPTEKELDALW